MSLSQITPPTQEHFVSFLLSFIILASVLVPLAIGLRALLRKGAEERRILPDPVRFKHVEEVVSEVVCKERHMDTNGRIIGIERMLESFRNERKEESAAAAGQRKSTDARIEETRREVLGHIEGVHRRVDEILSAVSEVRGELRQMSRS